MQKLLGIDEIDEQTSDLFEAAGFLDAGAFAFSDVEAIHQELVEANKMLGIVEEVPSVEQVTHWRSEILGAAATEKNERVEREYKEKKAKPKPIAVKSYSDTLYAIPLGDDFVTENEFTLEDLPTLERVNTGEHKQTAVTPDPRTRGLAIKPAVDPTVDQTAKEKNFEERKWKSFDHFRDVAAEVAAAKAKNEMKSNLTKTAKASTNEGVDSGSRRYVRGVLHSEAKKMKRSAVAYVFTILLVLSSIIPVIYILMNPDQGLWGFLTPLILFIAMIVYVGVARKSMCPVCRQRQFQPKACRKHVKADKIPGFGYMLTTALHLIWYKWFRCIFCGTSIRVKE